MRVRRTQKKPNTAASNAASRPAAGKRDEERHAQLLHQDAGGVRADAEVGGVPERDEAGVATSRLRLVANSAQIAMSLARNVE
jgi:hypothetical protein